LDDVTTPAAVKPQRGDRKVVSTYSEEGHSIVVTRVVMGFAYAQNGNLHNPTPKYVFLADVDGVCIGESPLLRDAKSFVSDYIAGGCQ
jgi:hypothetical protein